MNLQQAIAAHLKNFKNIEGEYNPKKQAFIKGLLKLQLIASEIGIPLDKLQLSHFDESFGASNLPKISFTIEGFNFQLVLNGASLQLWSSGNCETFLLPSENLGLALNLQISIADKVIQSQKHAIA